MSEETANFAATLVAAVALLVGLYGAVLATRSARSSDSSAKAAKDSAAAALQAVDIARVELHQARAPRFDFRIFNGPAGRASLVLLGPQDLASITMEIMSLDPKGHPGQLRMTDEFEDEDEDEDEEKALSYSVDFGPVIIGENHRFRFLGQS